jgi:carbonic anhydrase/acetyltransferase-like protein (isoleucine patch superfamily)
LDEIKGCRRMATLIELDGVAPTIGRDVWLAPTAVLIGDVRVGDRANIWFGTVLRGDFSYIEVGEEASIQDNAVVHCGIELPTIIGRRVTLGHGSLVEGCVIEDHALIGMGAIVLHHAHVGEGAMLAAGTVLTERATAPARMLTAGVPGRPKKEMSGAAGRWPQMAADDYQQLSALYLDKSVAVESDPTRTPAEEM